LGIQTPTILLRKKKEKKGTHGKGGEDRGEKSTCNSLVLGRNEQQYFSR
jgi:hypothetical protein